MNKEKGLFFPYLALILAMVLWGNSFIMIKVAYRAYSPNFVMFSRMALSSLLFIPFLGRLKKDYRRGDAPYLILMALCEPVLYFTFEARALEFTTASQAGMITALLPLLVAFPSIWILKEKLSLTMILGFLLAIFGALWLSLSGKPMVGAPNPLLGNFLEFLAMVSASGFTIASRKLSRHYSPLSITVVQSFIGAFYFLIRMVFEPSAIPQSFPLVPSLAILYLGIMVSMLAYGLYNFGISRTSASGSSVFVNLIPIVTLVSAMILLDEKIGPLQIAASAVILLGVVVSQIRKKDREKELVVPVQ